MHVITIALGGFFGNTSTSSNAMTNQLTISTTMKQTTNNHGWVITGVNPLTELREVISNEMLWDVAVSRATTNHTHRDVKIMRYNPQEINKKGVIKQQSLSFGDSHRIETTEEGVIYCDGLTCAAWMNETGRCDNCPITTQKLH